MNVCIDVVFALLERNERSSYKVKTMLPHVFLNYITFLKQAKIFWFHNRDKKIKMLYTENANIFLTK